MLNDHRLGGPVAENDRFEKSIGAGWRTAANYVENENASSEEIGDKLVESLVGTLRKFKGVPGFKTILEVLEVPVGVSVLDTFCTLENIVRERDGHRHTKIAANVAKSFLANGRKSEIQDKAHRLSENVCLVLVRHFFFARVCPRMTAKGRFSNHKEFYDWQIGIEHSIQPRIERIAAQLVKNPNAENLITPRRTVKKVPTSVLLEEALV